MVAMSYSAGRASIHLEEGIPGHVPPEKLTTYIGGWSVTRVHSSSDLAVRLWSDSGEVGAWLAPPRRGGQAGMGS